MRTRSAALLLIVASTIGAGGQAKYPPDIHPESLSRLPPVQRAELDEEGKRIWDALSGANKAIPSTGPSAVTMHSPRAAEPIYALNQYLRKTVAGARYFELAALIARKGPPDLFVRLWRTALRPFGAKRLEGEVPLAALAMRRAKGSTKKLAKDPDSGSSVRHGFSPSREFCDEEKHMVEKTCAACDCPLDGNAIQVTIGGHVVEVCCEECAEKLREAGAALVKALGIYPPGAWVRLASGETGVVIRRGASAATPRVAVLLNRDGMATGEPIPRDTAQAAWKIVSPVAHKEVRVRLPLEKLLAL